jgi:hypothetical protein
MSNKCMWKCCSSQIYLYDFYVSKLNIYDMWSNYQKFNWILVKVSYIYDKEEYNISTWNRLTYQEWVVKELV